MSFQCLVVVGALKYRLNFTKRADIRRDLGSDQFLPPLAVCFSPLPWPRVTYALFTLCFVFLFSPMLLTSLGRGGRPEPARAAWWRAEGKSVWDYCFRMAWRLSCPQNAGKLLLNGEFLSREGPETHIKHEIPLNPLRGFGKTFQVQVLETVVN